MGIPGSLTQPRTADYEALSHIQTYVQVRDDNVAVVPGEAAAGLRDLTSAASGLVNRAQRLPDVLGAPAWTVTIDQSVTHPGPGAPFYTDPATGRRYAAGAEPLPPDGQGVTYTRKSVAITDFIRAALDTADSMRSDLAGKSRDYQAIIASALEGVAPTMPRSMSDERAADIKPDMVNAMNAVPAGLARGQMAQKLLSQALADNDSAALYVLLGPPMKRAWLAYTGDVSLDTLRTIYARRIAAQGEQNGYQVTKAMQFVVLQDDPNALSGLVPAALAVYDYYRSAVQALLAR